MTKLYSDRENESDSQARFFLDQALFYDPCLHVRVHAYFWQTCLEDGDQAPRTVQHQVAFILAKYRGEYDRDTCYQGGRSLQALGERKKCLQFF